ncbi:MAG: hypothetical protein C4K60_03440 [Ideonella sp. MAG2]|nr:MAG: hypothetical protein C4K60_03440 [Ideonella sp. MAG2]
MAALAPPLRKNALRDKMPSDAVVVVALGLPATAGRLGLAGMLGSVGLVGMAAGLMGAGVSTSTQR